MNKGNNSKVNKDELAINAKVLRSCKASVEDVISN